MTTDFMNFNGDSLDKYLGHEMIEINEMMLSAGLINIKFSDKIPYWVAVGEKK